VMFLPEYIIQFYFCNFFLVNGNHFAFVVGVY
jgi:hypothetical protein